jgi:TatD DNase family protein
MPRLLSLIGHQVFLLVVVFLSSQRVVLSFDTTTFARPFFRRGRLIRSMSSATAMSYIDIGANLLDERFTDGIYRGTYRHEPDLDLVLQRALDHGVKRILLTAGTVTESRRAVQAVREWRKTYPAMHFSCTVGVHPTRCQQEFVDKDVNPDEILQELLEIAQDGMTDQTCVAIGEIGLDYDRLEFCSKEIQQTYLVKQLESLAKPTGLPLFLHNRSVGSDLYDILKQQYPSGRGVVHSFDDTLELANKFIDDLGLYIGLNGCSLRSSESLAVVKELPLSNILLETDCPYCEIRKTHPGYQYIQTHLDDAKAEKKFERGKCVKSRQEPCHIVQVAEIVAGCKGVPLQQVADACYQNSLNCFYQGEQQEE